MAGRGISFCIFHFAFFILHSSLLTSYAAAQVQLPELSAAEPIAITAEAANRWQLGSYDVWILRGNCRIEQGDGYASSREAVLWIDRAEPTEQRTSKVIAYLEGDVEVAVDRRPDATRLTDRTWLGRFFSSANVQVRAASTAGKPDVLPPVYWRGMERRAPESADTNWRPQQPSGTGVSQAQYTVPAPLVGPETVPAPVGSPAFFDAPPGAPNSAMVPVPRMGEPPAMSTGARRIRVYPRSDVPVQAKWLPPVAPGSNQWIAVIDSGVNVIVEGANIAELGAFGELGTVDILTDRLVIWTVGTKEPDLSGADVQDGRVPLEFYMEGNIVFRQGERTIYADRMYYDVPNQVGTVLGADLLTPVDNYEGLLRLHADVLQQTAKDRFFGKNVFVTSSRMGEPGYRLQTGDLYFEDIERPVVDPVTGQQMMNLETGQPIVEREQLATASNNFLYLGPVPIFYWPMLATDLSEPTYYIDRAQLKQDNVYGIQVLTDWNGYELLGIRNRPDGTDFKISLDYLGKRGFGHGGTFTYDREGFFGIPGHTGGLADYWGIQDQGTDDLGQGRMDVPPEKSYRYRLFWQHRHVLPYDLQLSAELGWISDRNFLEEYYKSEWEELKDETTGVELKRITENRSWSLSADYRLNDFFTQTDWLPRGDHFWIGQSLFNDAFTWYEHSNAAYARFRRATVPTDPVADGPFNYMPWEQYQVQGERLATRQEIDWPFQLSVVKVVPYALGEAAHWGADETGNSLDRLFGQVGVRASMPMWSVDPTLTSELFNVHGVAHKIVFEAEFFCADANRDLTDLPLYDPLDDDSVEAFRRRLMTSTFGIPSMITVPPGVPPAPILIPAQFDERLYAVRTGLQSWVTSPSTEIADDLAIVRLGARQRWQTKRGPANNRRIIDWVTLDTNITLFPDPDRDNFGTAAGLLDYDFRWHVGDRLTLVSDAVFDFFDQGQKIISVGGFLTRPPRGSLYAGFRILEGPIHHDILSFSYNYWMSPKWVSSFGTSIDLGNQGNIGQNFSVTHVGESLLISAGFTVDAARKDVGVGLAIEPRFLSKNRLGSVGGVEIPPAGAFGLE